MNQNLTGDFQEQYVRSSCIKESLEILGQGLINPGVLKSKGKIFLSHFYGYVRK